MNNELSNQTDNEARRNDATGPDGSGVGEIEGSVGMPTGDPSALGGGPGGSEGWMDVDESSIGDSGGIDDLTIKPASDASLGLTGTPDHPSEDWATETGPTHTPEER